MPPQTKEQDSQRARINHLEHIQSQSLTAMRSVLSQMCWYWINERNKLFGIVTKIVDNKADIVVFNAGWSGGIGIINDSEMLIRIGDTPDDELIKENKWEPFMTLADVLEEELKTIDSAPASEPDAALAS